MTMKTIVANYAAPEAGTIRRQTYDEQECLVVPVVMIVQGVLNNDLLLVEEFGKFPAAWNGRPVPVLHPEDNGIPVSANRPDIMETSVVGHIFNTHVAEDKLVAELWINVAKATARGHGELIAFLEAGGTLEVSTGYYADDEMTSGEYKGKPYTAISRNIVPDHLALLPGQIGACSIEDGCGTRTKQRKGFLAMKVTEAWDTLTEALGLNVNTCECKGEPEMDPLKMAQDALKNNAITPAQFKMIQDMAPEDRVMLGAVIQALGTTGEPATEEPEEMADELPEELPGVAEGDKPPYTQSQIDTIVAKAVDAAMARKDVVDRLTANANNKLTPAQMKAMSTEHLQAVEEMIRPADYSGAGGFASNASAVVDANVTPMPLRGVLSKKG